MFSSAVVGKIQRGAHKRGLKPQIFRENRGEILPGKSGLFGANSRLFGADRDQILCTPQPREKSRNCPERVLFGPIGPFRAKPPFAKPPFGFPRGWRTGRGGCVRNIGHEHDFCQAQQAQKEKKNADPCTNYAVKYATARGHLPLQAHTPHNFGGVPFHPLNFGGGVSETSCFTMFSGGHPLNLGGEIVPPYHSPRNFYKLIPLQDFFLYFFL